MDFPKEPAIKKARFNVNSNEDNDKVFGGITSSSVPILSGYSTKNSSEFGKVITFVILLVEIAAF